MKLSDQTGELFSALADFQKEHPEIVKDQKVKVKKNGKFIYDFEYATLGNMIKTVTPTLAKHGLSVTQSVGNSGVVTIIGHKSGQYLITEPLQVDFSGSEQDQGSSITYKRRYQFGGALNLDSVSDDDGNIASGNEPELRNQTKEKPQPKAPEKETKPEPQPEQEAPSQTDDSDDLQATIDSFTSQIDLINWWKEQASKFDDEQEKLKWRDVAHKKLDELK